MANSITTENSEPAIFPLIVRVTAAMILGSILFLGLGMTVVGWKICCDLGSTEFTERASAVSFVIEEMEPEWPFQSIVVDTNNAGDILIQRNWLGMSELQATIYSADHEREVAENNQLEPTFAADTEWVFYNDFERGNGVTAKSGLVAVGVIGLIFGALGFMRRLRERVS